MQWIIVAIGGALGALCRYGITQLLPPGTHGFPWATWWANVSGSLLIGLCYVVIVDKGLIAEQWRPLLMVGFLGALTTFSSFALDAFLLWQQGQVYISLIYTVSSVITCLLAVALTIQVLQRLL
ncbi:MAG: fluoride efflux transporter CrcB [Pseudomonadota bacterium]